MSHEKKKVVPWTKFKNQDYGILKQTCTEKKELFNDKEFSRDNKHLPHGQDVVWKRTTEICNSPTLRLPPDPKQNYSLGKSDGNHALLSAIATLHTQFHDIFWDFIAPNHESQEWNTEDPNNYRGIFVFRFYINMQKLEVVVDDYLPTVNGKLIHMQILNSQEEFWLPLLEKALAKVFGGYKELSEKDLGPCLEYFTGGMSELIDLKPFGVAWIHDIRVQHFERLQLALHENSAIVTGIMNDKTKDNKSEADNQELSQLGLRRGEGYAVTKVAQLGVAADANHPNEYHYIIVICLRNVWGHRECKWSGSEIYKIYPELKSANPTDIAEAGVNDANLTGEFWMRLRDFSKYFDSVCICNNTNGWVQKALLGEWSKSQAVAGGWEDIETIHQNPQFILDLEEGENNDHLMAQLVRKYKPTDRHSKIRIKLNVFKIEVNRNTRMYRPHLQTHIGETAYGKNSTETLYFTGLKPFKYAFVPVTKTRGDEGEFMLRICTRAESKCLELTPSFDITMEKMCWCIKGRHFPRIVTRISVQLAAGMDVGAQHISDEAGIYCVMNCEGQTISGLRQKNPTKKDWHDSRKLLHLAGIFFRVRPKRNPLEIAIMSTDDDCLGRFVWKDTGEHRDKNVVLEPEDGWFSLGLRITQSKDIWVS